MTAGTEPQPRVRGHPVAVSAALNLAGLVAPLLVAFVTLPILIDGLGDARFGVLAIAWMVLTYLSELGLGSTTTRYAAEAVGAGRTSELGAIAWTTAGLQLGIGVVEGVALALATPWLVGSVLNISPELEGAARASLWLLAAAIPIAGLGKSFRGLLEAAQRFDLALLVHLPATAAGYVLAAVAAQLGWPLPWVFGLIVLSRASAFPAYLIAARRALPGVSLRPRWLGGRLREMLGFAGWASVSTIVSPLLVYLDRFMVGALLSMTAVAYYAAPYEVVARLALVPAGLVGALYPAFSQLSGERSRADAETLAARSVNVLMVLLAPVLVLILGGAADGLTLWLGPEYARHSALALQILAFGVLANAAAHVPFGLLQGMGRPDLPARLHLLELPLQVILAWVLVSRYGIPGAALAWTLRILLDTALLFGTAARIGVLRPGAFLRTPLPRTLGITAAAGGAALLAAGGLGGSGARLAAAAGISAVAAVMLLATGTTTADRRRLLGLVRPGGRHE
ncbi:MAG: flippase [Gemmatimonadetes bacterium]|nr:flippase [Gemmatimonadota bacterium]